jgi:hypothetical protein
MSGVRRRAAGAAVAVVLAAVGLGLWFGLRGSTSTASPELGPSTTATARSITPVGPIAVTAAELRARAATLGQDVYWLGPLSGRRYELERTADGQVFVRYLAAGGHDATTVGTYPLPAAYDATESLAREDGWAQEHVEAWLVAYPTSRSATTVYLAAEGFPYQIEVYDPTPGRARTLVESGAVGPVR